MSWKAPFTKGISSFRASQFEDSLSHLNEAIQVGHDQYAIYDSRASVFEKLGRLKDALRDAKKVIDLAPDRWQGYARSARLFLQLNKHDPASKMVDLALERVNGCDTKRRVELESLKSLVVSSKSILEEKMRRDASLAAYHAGKLPVEIFGDIFALLVAIDATQAISVSHVCRHWRAVALNTPSLWRILVLAKKNPATKAKEWIKRSQGHIRELRIRTSFYEGSTELPTALQGFPWDRLRICRFERTHMAEIGHILKDLSMFHIFSNLNELELVGWPNEQKWAFTSGMSMSQLQSLTIKNHWLCWEDISAHNLVSLIITNPLIFPHGSLLDVLQANPMLEKVIIETLDHVIFLTPGTPTPPFSLSHLTHLDFKGFPVHTALCDIAMPCLRILCMTRVTAGAGLLLASLLDQGPIVLTELSIHSSVITSSMLIPFLKAASSLETFGLSHVHGHVNTVVEALATMPLDSTMTNTTTITEPSSHETLICPSLRHITLSACSDLKTGALMRLVKSRLPLEVPVGDDSAPAMAQIETLAVDQCPDIEPEILPWLRSRVRYLSCVYATKKAAQWKR